MSCIHLIIVDRNINTNSFEFENNIFGCQIIRTSHESKSRIHIINTSSSKNKISFGLNGTYGLNDTYGSNDSATIWRLYDRSSTFSYGYNNTAFSRNVDNQCYVTFNTFNGQKNLTCVSNINEIESITLENRIDLMYDNEVKLRNIEIDKLKNERIFILDIIDILNFDKEDCELMKTFNNSRFSLIHKEDCDLMKTFNNSRFSNLNTKEELYEELKFITEQIEIHMKEVKKLMMRKDENLNTISKCIVIPYGKICRITEESQQIIGKSMFRYDYDYDCYWTYGNDVDNNEMEKRNMIIDFKKEQKKL